MLAIFGPIWVLAGLGYAARRLGLLDDAAAGVLGRFVYLLAMPATLFLTLARTPLSDFTGVPLVAFGTSTAIVLAAGGSLARWWLHRKPAEQVIWGMSAGYVNSANLGIPIAMRVLHSDAFLVQVVLLQTLVVTPLILMALEHRGAGDGRRPWRTIASLPLRNPVILASALGVVAAATGYQLPAGLNDPLTLLGAAAVPTALVALGAALHSGPGQAAADTRPVTLSELAAVTTLKLVVQPAIAFVTGAFALDLTRSQLLAV